MIAIAPCPQCPASPTPLARLTDQAAQLWQIAANATKRLVPAPRARPRRHLRPPSLTLFNRRTLDDINAPDWLYQELALRQETSRLDTLRLRASGAFWP